MLRLGLDAEYVVLHILVIIISVLSRVTQALLFNVTVTLQGLCIAARCNAVCFTMCGCVFSVLLCITVAVLRRLRRLSLYLQVFCSKVSPNCGACPLQASCEYALNNGKRLQLQPMKPSSVQRQVGGTLSTHSQSTLQYRSLMHSTGHDLSASARAVLLDQVKYTPAS